MTHAIGTKVKVTKAIGGLSVGDVTTITGYGKSVYPYQLADPGGPGGHSLFLEREFEVVAPEPKFKVGDRVTGPIGYACCTESGTVKAVRPDRIVVLPDKKRFSHGCAPAAFPGAGSFPPGVLKKIEKSSQEFKLKKGDRVKNLKTGRTGWVFHSYVTNELAVSDHAHRPPTAYTRVPAKALEAWEAEHPGTYDIVKNDAPW